MDLWWSKKVKKCHPQTGSGKTAAFLLPIIHRMIENDADAGAGPQCIVVTPTRWLYTLWSLFITFLNLLEIPTLNSFPAEALITSGLPCLLSGSWRSKFTMRRGSLPKALWSKVWWLMEAQVSSIRSVGWIGLVMIMMVMNWMILNMVSDCYCLFFQASQLQRGCNILVATPGRFHLT